MDAPDLPSVETPDEEQAREQRWHWFEVECREFAKSEPDGFAAVLRAVSRAMKDDAPYA
jgi:hypothetical protein